jgi:hypothetical protein
MVSEPFGNVLAAENKRQKWRVPCDIYELYYIIMCVFVYNKCERRKISARIRHSGWRPHRGRGGYFGGDDISPSYTVQMFGRFARTVCVCIYYNTLQFIRIYIYIYTHAIYHIIYTVFPINIRTYRRFVVRIYIRRRGRGREKTIWRAIKSQAENIHTPWADHRRRADRKTTIIPLYHRRSIIIVVVRVVNLRVRSYRGFRMYYIIYYFVFAAFGWYGITVPVIRVNIENSKRDGADGSCGFHYLDSVKF